MKEWIKRNEMREMLVEIKPTNKQLCNWIEQLVPKRDLYFVEDNDLTMLEGELNEVLVIPVNEFYNHPSYRQIQLANSYTYWDISNKAEFVIVAQPSWITNLSKQSKKHLLKIQLMMGRGLIFPYSFFPPLSPIAQEHVVMKVREEQFVILQYEMWNELPLDIKLRVIREYALLWDSWSSYEVPSYTPNHISRYANRFSDVPGSNCLSATLFAITKQDWILDEWIHPETFKKGLEKASFIETNSEFQKDDVVIWVNENHVIQHAAYHIGDNLFFNKNGQTVFNPWKIIHWNQLNKQWARYKKKIYRIKL